MRFVRRVVIAVVGGTVLLIGVLLIVLPGPASLVIPLGLAILALEFCLGKRWLDKARSYMPGNKGKKSNDGTPSDSP